MGRADGTDRVVGGRSISWLHRLQALQLGQDASPFCPSHFLTCKPPLVTSHRVTRETEPFINGYVLSGLLPAPPSGCHSPRLQQTVPRAAPAVGGGCVQMNPSDNIRSGPPTLASHLEKQWDLKAAL